MRRRLAAMLATDIAEYSRLVGQDEEGTLAARQIHRVELIDPLLQRFGGRVANTAGDSLLIEFPSAVEAVRFALAFRDGMAERNVEVPEDRQVRYRTGINVGDVVSEGDDLLGDGVNIAARLEALAPPGGILLSRSVRDSVRDRLNLNLADLGEVKVKNISRPVRAFQVLRPGETPVSVKRQGQSRMPIVVTAALVLTTAIGGSIYWNVHRQDFKPADPQKMPFALSSEPSIAVLPFENLSGDPSADYLGGGISEAINSTLVLSPELLVIAASSSATFKDKAVPVSKIAEQLGVRYVLRGSVQKEKDELRVTAELLDAINGKVLWSDKYDRPISDIFAVQDEISQSVLKEIQVRLTFESRGESRMTKDFREYLNYLEWKFNLTKFSPDGIATAFSIARQLHGDKPGSALANEMMGMTYYVDTLVNSSANPKADLVQARRFYDKAVELNPKGANYQWRGWVDVAERNYKLAIQDADKGLAIAPNDADRLRSAGAVKALAGQPAEGVRLMKRAMRRTPIGSEWVVYETAFFLTLLGKYDEARKISLDLLSKETRDVRAHAQALQSLTAISVFQGDLPAARTYAQRLLKLDPNASIQSVMKDPRAASEQDFVKKYADALRTAGIPEKSPKSPVFVH